MPVVVCNIQRLSGVLSSNAFNALLLVTGLWLEGSAVWGQDAALPAAVETAPSAAGTDPADVTAVTSPLAQESSQSEEVAASLSQNVPTVADGCEAEVLAQQKMVRTIRAMRNPLPHPDKATADKLRRQFTQLVSTGFTNAADTKVVQDYLAWMILQATDDDFAVSTRNMENLIEDVTGSVIKAGANAAGGQAGKDKERRKYCAEVLKVTRSLLDNNLDARLAALQIMQGLYDVIGVQGGPTATRIHPEALATMLSVINDVNQPDAVKAVAASSVRNVLMNCEVSEQDQFRISDALFKELTRPCTEAAFQMVLLDAAYRITKPRRTVNPIEPTTFKIFAMVLNDRARPVEVRCHAAQGFGICNYDVANTKFDAIAWKVTQLAGDAALEYSKDPGHPKWPECGSDLLFTFRHNSAAEATAAPPATKGIMNRAPNSKVVSDAAPFVMTVSLRLIANKGKFTPQEIAILTNMKAWLDSNVPDLKWDQAAPPFAR